MIFGKMEAKYFWGGGLRPNVQTKARRKLQFGSQLGGARLAAPALPRRRHVHSTSSRVPEEAVQRLPL